MKYRTNRTNTKSKRPLIIWSLALLGVAAITITALELTDTTYLFHKKPIEQTASQDTKGEPQASDSSGTKSPNNTPADQGGSTPEKNGDDPVNPGVKLLTPDGNFVSNHHPNLSGSPAPNTMQSSCATSPGAMCQITFTKDGATKSLPAQKTDAGGGTYWTWKLQDIGLGEGSWKVQAKATLGSQTATADDALTLEVNK